TASTNANTGSLNINIVSPIVTTAPLGATHADFFVDEAEVYMSNITTTYLVPSTPNTRIHKDHSLDHVIGDVQSGIQTRRMTKTTHEYLHTCLFACFLSQEEPKKVWTLVDLPHGKRAIGTKWVYRNKKDERVARNEAIRRFLAMPHSRLCSNTNGCIRVAFRMAKIKEEVSVCQPIRDTKETSKLMLARNAEAEDVDDIGKPQQEVVNFLKYIDFHMGISQDANYSCPSLLMSRYVALLLVVVDQVSWIQIKCLDYG
ncbi:hypothetical protein Tco_0779761, partial [Tanacetum coccineum]